MNKPFMDTLSVLFPGIIGCFGSFNRHPLPGDLTEFNQALACVQVPFCYPHMSPHSHFDALSATAMLLLMALLQLVQVIPSI